MQSTLYTSDFHRQYEAETADLLRTRFLWFSGLVASGLLLIGALRALVLVQSGAGGADEIFAEGARTVLIGFASLGLLIAFYAACFAAVGFRRVTGDGLLKLTYWVVVAHGALELALAYILNPAHTSPGLALTQITLVHVLASVFLPWTPRQAIRPLAILLGLNALGALALGEAGVAGRIAGIALSPPIGLPGVVICWIRHSRRLRNLKLRFLQRRYGEVRQELVEARRIHEALFPPTIPDGPVRFGYVYEPMHQIGGDFLHVQTAHSGSDESAGNAPISVVIMDVTGHGIPAALTVNRLHGELARLFAENPDIAPGEVLCNLNRYVHLTLATHSVYVTALCLRADPARDRLEYASGGHPPAFLCGIDGSIRELESTALVLGATSSEDFQSGSAAHTFGSGDALIAYTDGATEARNRAGRMLGVEGLRRAVAGREPRDTTDWPGEILRVVERHRWGPPADDTLVVGLTRPLAARRTVALGQGAHAASDQRSEAASPAP